MIPSDKQRRIRRLLVRSDSSASAIAREVGVTPKAVLRVLRLMRPDRPQRGETVFRRVASYQCNGCQAKVYYRPCPACAARFAKR